MALGVGLAYDPHRSSVRQPHLAITSMRNRHPTPLLVPLLVLLPVLVLLLLLLLLLQAVPCAAFLFLVFFHYKLLLLLHYCWVGVLVRPPLCQSVSRPVHPCAWPVKAVYHCPHLHRVPNSSPRQVHLFPPSAGNSVLRGMGWDGIQA